MDGKAPAVIERGRIAPPSEGMSSPASVAEARRLINAVAINQRLRSGDVVGVMATSYCPQFIGRIDVIHWNTDPVWISLIDVDTGEWHSAQLQHVVGKLKDRDPAPRPAPPSSLGPPPADDPPGIGIVFAN